MKIPLSLIKTFLHIDEKLSQISETLTLLGIEVDSIHNEAPPFGGVVIGKVLSAKRHPDAERLQIAEVSDGVHQFQLVCAAENCRAGLKTAFAKVGSWILDSNGKKREIEQATLRGVSSSGMLCSAADLNLWEDNQKILELPDEWQTGKELIDLLWDPIFELSLTPNLGHCLSALGIARELAAGLQKPIHRKKISVHENQERSIDNLIEASVHDESLCPRYTCRVIEGVKIGPSPLWLEKELHGCGLKPISNAVDIVNYVMAKVGQPMHAFDYDLIEGASIEIAPAETAKKFIGLDEIEREIVPGVLLISDAKKTIAIAGVIGGKNSAVTEATQNILLEAAYFDPATIRNGAKKVGIRTESAIRFEKGVDPNGTLDALDEAAQLIAQICGGRVAKGAIDLKKREFTPKDISCRLDRVNRILGTHLSLGEIEECFHRLGFQTQPRAKETLAVSVPRFRFDINEEIDLLEEVARIYGYNNIEKKNPSCIPSKIPHDPVYLFENEIRRRAIALGLQQVLTSDLISPRLAELSKEFEASHLTLLKAIHAKTEEYSVLRPSLLPGLAQVVKHNLDQKNTDLSAFEIGRIHFHQKGQNVEIPLAALILTGKTSPEHWHVKPKEVDFFYLKGLLETLLASLKIPSISFAPSEHISFHPSRQANICSGSLVIGSLGELHPHIAEKLDIKQKVYFAELNIPHLMSLQKKKIEMTPLSTFPSSDRDWTISLPLKTHIDSVFEAIQKFQPHLLEKVELIDLYFPENSHQKNGTFRFTYRDRFRTISFQEVDAEHSALIDKVTNLLAK